MKHNQSPIGFPVGLFCVSLINASFEMSGFTVYNNEELNQLYEWATIKINVVCFYKMGTFVGNEWAKTFEILRNY